MNSFRRLSGIGISATLQSSLWHRASFPAVAMLFAILTTGAIPLAGLHAEQEQFPAGPRSFRKDVLPIVAKAGCNSGVCHGALSGKGGFKLSLRGYDPASDYMVIARQSGGRRLELSDPGRSLFLAKPSGGIPHKGGLRFEVDSLEYRIIAEWIAQGALPPAEGDPRVERIEVLPKRVSLDVGQSQQVHVRAHYTSGDSRDVTRWAKFDSTDNSVATISDDGELTVTGHGEGAVTAWYTSKIAMGRVVVAYPNEIDQATRDEFQVRNFIDQHVLEQLERLNLPPSRPADDATFLRRAFLNTTGTLPSAEEVRNFLTDSSNDKRDRVIDSLLSRAEFVDYWTHKWSDVLLIDGKRLPQPAVQAYYQWLHRQVERNTPWDELVYDVIVARGSSLESGATNFYTIHADAESMTENVCQAFLGLSIGCAKCHNHPLEKWTNDQYYAMASHFARVRAKGWAGNPTGGDGLRTLFVTSGGELIQPLSGSPQPATPLDGEPLDSSFQGDRRVPLAQWLTSSQNTLFSRAIANRIWQNFLGIGLVEPVDDLRTSNPASNEELLAAIANYLVEHDFDLKALMRAILRSSTYSLSSRVIPGNEKENRYFSHYYPRRLSAEVLLDAVSQATNVPSRFTRVRLRGADFKDTDFYPEGTRAVQLYDAAVVSYFLKTFGRNPRNVTCECERSNVPSMVQVLHIANGTTIREKLADDRSITRRLLTENLPAYGKIEEIYLATLSRYPTDKELQQLLPYVAGVEGQQHQESLEDLVWSVLSSREFLFNH
ncbi:MAG: S-layer protein [Planctomycetaceae bacterium]|nr:S-layer protein [Planctomycetaceae bacterium]MBP62116.1 S-layer protein [Planctomycetaceae bacterium]